MKDENKNENQNVGPYIEGPVPVMYSEDLDKISSKCCNPNCKRVHNPNEPIVLTAACHPGCGVFVTYVRQSGLLHFECSICRAAISDIAVMSLKREGE